MQARAFLKRYDALLARHGSQRAVAEHLGIPRTTIQYWLARKDDILFTERPAPAPRRVTAPKKGVKRFIFTAAQAESAVHEPFLDNLVAYAAHLDAELHIAGFTYEKRLYEDNRKDVTRVFYPQRLLPYMTNDRFYIGDKLVFCGNMNTLPTAQTPLAGFEVYTGGRDGIFPHAKVQLVSIPTMKHDPAKIIMTTGSVTMRNYIQRRAGILAEFHHIIGAVIVEIDADGDHFCRHLLANEEDGSFQDLNHCVANSIVSTGHTVEAVNWGDIHLEKMDWDVAQLIWGIEAEGCIRMYSPTMIDDLRPSFQFMHDSIDFTWRNHHNFPHDPHFRYKTWIEGTESVQDTMVKAGAFLEAAARDYCTTVVVESNHDKAALKWLKTAEWRDDPPNAEFYLEAQLAALRAIRTGQPFSVLEWSLGRSHPEVLNNITFLLEDESFTICAGKIECGMHGHLGGNGARGHPRSFTKMGNRANTGHTHSAGIMDGIYTAGVSGKLDMVYNSGLSSWTHSHIITYSTGKRTIVTMRNGKYRAR